MTLRLFNTLSRAIETFEPVAAPLVTLYTCGPTVYNYAHIGNFRTFLFEDLLRRWLDASGYSVFHVMNLTDVDDKTIRGAQAAGRPLSEHVLPFIAAFHDDRAYLRIKDAAVYPRATEFIAEQIALVESLLAKGVAYRGDDGSVYFSIAEYPAYGKLSQLDRRQLRAGASGRTSEDEYDKENAQDFVLWKAAKPEDEAVGAAWDAPFGRGRPGWHLECSAMALALIEQHAGAQVLDIHAGGVDLIFPHHEDEIAQSCAHTGEALFSRYWMHGEFLTLAGTKMSKRYGNILTARDLKENGVDAGAVRYLIASTHYRQRLDWTDEALEAAGAGSRALGELRDRLEKSAKPVGAPAFDELADRAWESFQEAMDDDLSSPRALATIQVFRADANRMLDEGLPPGPRVIETWNRMDGVLAVSPDKATRFTVGAGDVAIATDAGSATAAKSEVAPTDPAAAQEWALGWATLRFEAKRKKNFPEADRIRTLLSAAGFEIRDAKDGTVEVVRTSG